MEFEGVNKDGSTFDADCLSGCSQAVIVDRFPNIDYIREVETDDIVWRIKC